MTKEEAIKKVIAFAESRVGYLEKSASAYNANHNIVFEMTAGAGKDNRCEAWEILKPSYNKSSNPWCQGFVHLCFHKALGSEDAKKVLYLDRWKSHEPYTYYACASWCDNFEQNGARCQSSKAEVGDIIYFTKSHTGIVYKVTSDTIYTIEGNTSGGSAVISNGGSVCKKQYVRGCDAIKCYGKPDWNAICNGKSDAKGDDIEMTVLRKGMHNDKCIQTFQILMKHYGYYTMGIDGSYGPGSEKACRDYQEDHGLEVDGICGKQTWTSLLKG